MQSHALPDNTKTKRLIRDARGEAASHRDHSAPTRQSHSSSQTVRTQDIPRGGGVGGGEEGEEGELEEEEEDTKTPPRTASKSCRMLGQTCSRMFN